MTEFLQVDEVLGSAIDRGDVPGVVAMAGTRDGIVYQGAFGRRALSNEAAMSTDTVFWIASMTKAITSIAAMQLVEQGKLALDHQIGDVLPELSAPQVFEGFNPSGGPRLRPAKRSITLRHLLTHTAGLVYEIWNAEMGRYMETKAIPGIISCQNAALSLPLVFDPGEKWDYGINIDWVGKAVERVSGQLLGDYFAEHLFGPIGMKDTAFKLTQERRARLASMHARGPDGNCDPEPVERCGVFSRHGQEMGPWFYGLNRTSAGWTQRRKSRLGGPRKYLFLDRSRQGRGRSHFDATPALRRPQGPGSARPV
jgi:methyl acetate hydrolase